MNLRKLSHLLAVLEARNLRAAADAVHLSQPALSRSLKSLEDELGIPLLDRAYGRVVPTAYSGPVLEHIRKLMSEARALRESVRRLKGLEEGELRVGFGPLAAAIALESVITDIVSRHPALTLHIELTNSPLLIELLKEDRLDLVVCDSRYVIEDDMSWIRLSSQPFAFAVQRDHPLLQYKGTLPLKGLKGYPLGAPTLPLDLMAQMRDHGLVPQIVCDDMRSLLQLVSTTQAVVMLPQLVVHKLGAARGLLALPVKAPFDLFATPCVLTAKGRTPGPAATLAIELLKQHLNTPQSSRARRSQTSRSPV